MFDKSATPVDETNSSEGNVGINLEVLVFQNILKNKNEEVDLRRSSRTSKLPAKLNDYVLNNTASLNKSCEPSSFKEASKDVNWINDMNNEMRALYENNTWELVDLPYGRKPIGSRRVYKIKYMSTGEIERYKAIVVAKGYNQKEGIDYDETFSHVVKMNDLDITGNSEIDKLKTFLNKKFKMKDLGEPMLTPLPENIVLAQKETKDDKPDISYSVHCPSQHMHALLQSHFNLALRLLRHLKLAHGSGIDFSKDNSGIQVVAYSDSDWAKCPMTRKFVSGYCVFVNKSLVSWKSKKQPTLSKSSAEAEYRAMTATTYEVMWIVKILKDMGLKYLLHVELHCDNKATIQIAANPVMHEKTKHIDLDVHFVKEKVASGLIKTVKVDTKCQVADIFTKALGSFQHNVLMKTCFSYKLDGESSKLYFFYIKLIFCRGYNGVQDVK
nr:ribonuclease H-like domain-containing protein [Tanacetum cinerariifolium]